MFVIVHSNMMYKKEYQLLIKEEMFWDLRAEISLEESVKEVINYMKNNGQ